MLGSSMDSMTPFIHGFSSELVKLGSDYRLRPEDLRKIHREAKRDKGSGDKDIMKSIRGEGEQVSRDYLAGMLIGAGTMPGVELSAQALARKINNAEVSRAMAKAPASRRAELAAKIHRGKLVGSAGSKIAPLVTRGQLAGSAARGALLGSVVQMIRDRFSGAKGVKDDSK